MSRPSVAPDRRLLTVPFVAVLTGAALYFFNVGVVVPLLPVFAAADLGANTLLVGVVVGAPALAALVVRPLAGGFGNIIGRRRLMVCGAALAGLATLAYGAADHLAVLIALRLMTGAGEGAFFTGAATLVTDLAPLERRGTAITLLSVTVFAGAGLGPILAVPLADELGRGRAFVIAGLVAIVAAAVCLLARNPSGAPVARTQHARLNRKAVGPGTAMALCDMGIAGFFALVPLYALEVGTPVQTVFIVYSVVILGIRLGGSSIPDRLGPVRCGVVASILDAIGLLVIGISGNHVGLLVGVVVFSAGTALLYPALMSLALGTSAQAERSSIVGTFTMSFDVGALLGAVLLGGVAQALGFRTSFALAGVCALVGLVVLLRTARTSAATTSVSLTGT
ncbi:MFS transporter [Aeromicrobium panaciterrae]